MPRPRSAGVVALAVVLVTALVAVTAAVVLLRRPLPDVSGEVAVPGLGADVRVLRDERGVPQVYAEDADDLFFAQGYVHAQDRFFQMDLRRHVTAGRLAELVGDAPGAVEADAVVRTLGWRRVAEAELPLLAPETRAYLEAYAAGVNAHTAGRSPSELSAAYTALGTQVDLAPVEEWTPVDSLAWLKAMAWSLRANYGDELGRAAAYGAVGDVDLVEQLYPAPSAAVSEPVITAPGAPEPVAGTSGEAAPVPGPAPAEGPAAEAPGAAPEAPATAPAPEGDAAAAADLGDALDAVLADPSDPVGTAGRAMAAVPDLLGVGEGAPGGVGSNAWAVSGEHTATGAPLLADDPHLVASFPSTWSQVGLHCTTVDESCPFEVSGYSFAGMPGVVIGHNADIAWGFTNLGADVTDLFLEQIRGDSAVRAGEEVPLTTRTETIRVAGGDPVAITVRSTEHGPILSDFVPELAAAGRGAPVPQDAPSAGLGGYAVALSWTALTPGRTMDAVFALDAASGWEEFREAASLFAVPGQNLVYADTAGQVGYQSSGVVPVRQPGPGLGQGDGTWPRLGWDPAYDWAGEVPFEDMPSQLAPEDGLVVSANQAVTDAGSPFLTADFDQGHRAARIRSVLEEQVAQGRRITVEDALALQDDEHDPFAEVLVPHLLAAPLPEAQGTDPDRRAFTREAVALLRGWDGTTTADSAPAAYYNAVWSNLLRLTFADQLPEVAQPRGGSRWFSVVEQLLDEPDSPWWDDATTTTVVETRDQVLGRALLDARLELTASLGADPQDWEWGRLHRLTLRQEVLGGPSTPAPVRALWTAGPVELGGGTSLVDAASWDAREGYEVATVPSMRMVVDLGDLDASRWVDLAGVSEHPWSGHMTDQLGTWADGGAFPWPFTPGAVEDAARDELVLVPRAASED
ncbi:penicillin acylase family protein [uncultured Pseudokineococcus sp.]|uniref:penicillin acylase family protein n=1 Tax=uncultured Pseudokineococcus sp. TaxID=1642928 RepID=UPI002607E1E3|nr:penicillin acylase family protein [uncultured Pseudokineococcus sp.]